MGKTENPSIWEKIQKSVQETERLMGQKKYNLSMIKARQTLEYMVKLQCDKAGIVEGSVESMIRDLFDGGWISKSTAEHYLQIYSIGTKAVKENDNSAFNANQAYHVLSQEVYAFSNANKPARPRRAPAQSSQGSSSKSRKKQASSGINSTDLLKLLIPIALVVVLIFIIRILTPDKTPTNETLEPTETVTEAPTEAPTMTSTEASTEATTEAPVTYKTTDTLNVRPEPSTNSTRIGKLDPGAPVEYVRDHDDFWAVIQYNGQEAYVAKQYLTTGE